MKAVISIPALALVLGGCVSYDGFVRVSGVREARADEVTACAYVTDISGKPSVYGPLAKQGMDYIRNKIIADARAAGANTVVFDEAPAGVPAYELHAVAYRC